MESQEDEEMSEKVQEFDTKLKLFDNLLCAYHISETTIKTWGEDTQLSKTVEECAELIVALQHSRTRTLDIRSLASEIADVLVMVVCAARIVGVDLVAEEMSKKLARLKGRLETSRPKADLEEKYNKAVQLSAEMESRYYKELARSEDLKRQLLALQDVLPPVSPADEKVVNDMLAKQRQKTRKRKLEKRRK